MTTRDSVPEQAIAVVEQFNEAFGRGDVEAVMSQMTSDCVFESTSPAPDGATYRGQDSMRAFWTRFFTENADAHFEPEETFACEGRVVCRWRYIWGAAPSSGHVRGVDVFKVRDGKVAEKLSYVKG